MRNGDEESRDGGRHYRPPAPEPAGVEPAAWPVAPDDPGHQPRHHRHPAVGTAPVPPGSPVGPGGEAGATRAVGAGDAVGASQADASQAGARRTGNAAHAGNAGHAWNEQPMPPPRSMPTAGLSRAPRKVRPAGISPAPPPPVRPRVEPTPIHGYTGQSIDRAPAPQSGIRPVPGWPSHGPGTEES